MKSKPKTSFILYSRNDGYKEKERLLIHLKTMLETFDEVIYVDWNSDTHSLLYEVIDDLPKTGRLKHFVITPKYHKILTRNDPDAQRCCTVLAVNIALRRTEAEWIVIGNVDIIPPSKEDLNGFLSKANPNTFYTFSRRDVSIEQILLNKNNINEYREYLNNTSEPRYFPAKVTPNDNYSLINCCGDFQLAHKNVWYSVKGLEEEMLYACFVDTNVQKKAVLNNFGLEVVYDVPVYHMSHLEGKNTIPQGGNLDTLHESMKSTPPKFNDAWDWVERFEESQNTDSWGFGDTEIEFEIF
jgi:hypothetical protein